MRRFLCFMLRNTSCRVQSFYYDDKPMLSNEEFDNLKEELLWEGSRVAVLRCLSATSDNGVIISLLHGIYLPEGRLWHVCGK